MFLCKRTHFRATQCTFENKTRLWILKVAKTHAIIWKDYNLSFMGTSWNVAPSQHVTDIPPYIYLLYTGCYLNYDSFITGNNPRWDDAVRNDSTAWKKHVTKWLRNAKRPTLVVQYEKLQTNLDGELRRMLDFLEHPYTEDDIQCTINSSVEGFHRKHTKKLDPYTPSQAQFILDKIHLVNDILIANNISYHNVYT